ncbi:hypothetical protein C2S52_019709 [Perilla frutescens var. hirtella]|nr:hypothetical protein C2S52_019709 [Perilla frutescens var. hirtella]KAH6806048.1 hypothetical protein C2S51_030879 [Perilla frutescens var. frutescens]
MSDDPDLIEQMTETLTLVSKNFKRFQKKLQTRSPHFGKTLQDQNDGKQGDSKKVQCYECEGYSHIRYECANMRKKNKKSLLMTLSDEKTDGEGNQSHITFNVHNKAASGKLANDPWDDPPSDVEEITIEETMQNFTELK